uniref:Uncharacterized protein n=1 Tax=Arundo donax TaxID=35708 RepID=A0A0A9F7U0_ARUDO
MLPPPAEFPDQHNVSVHLWLTPQCLHLIQQIKHLNGAPSHIKQCMEGPY